jgi:hypothetical protein
MLRYCFVAVCAAMLPEVAWGQQPPPTGPATDPTLNEYIKVQPARIEVRGTLQMNVTGIGDAPHLISVRGTTFRLEFGDNKTLEDVARYFNGQTIIVQGTVDLFGRPSDPRTGALSSTRIIQVASLQPTSLEQLKAEIELTRRRLQILEQLLHSAEGPAASSSPPAAANNSGSASSSSTVPAVPAP